MKYVYIVYECYDCSEATMHSIHEQEITAELEALEMIKKNPKLNYVVEPHELKP